jgi:hypothetical protein
VTGSAPGSGGRARRRATRVAGSRAAALARLSELDRRILQLISTQRVLTQTQLARLLAEAPERTLRYRTERLFQLGLLGRSRPYREAGSHPYHFWPTRQADVFVRGGPVPRGGERAEPNPLFLAHAAGVSELYVLLATGAAEGLALHGFRREGEAREPFRSSGRECALAPDVLLDLDDEHGRQLLAFLELDLGTMSRPRLRAKAAGYAAYVYERAWAQRHPFCPALLFLTIGEARAYAFLKLLASELERHGRGRWQREEQERWFAAAACAHAHEPARALSERCWDDRALSGGLTLDDCLEQARLPYEEARAEAQARALERERRRQELLRDSTKLRRHLRREQRYALQPLLDRLGDPHARALQLLLEGEGEIDRHEQEALLMLARLLGEQLLDPDAPSAAAPGASERACVERLSDHYRQRQREQVVAFTRRFGEGPRLRDSGRQLEHGDLLDPYAATRLEHEARHDSEARRRQEQLRLAYLQRREREARQRARAHGLASYLLHGSTPAQAQIDGEWLRVCERCQEIAYPSEHEQDGYASPQTRQCHFCGSAALAPWDPRLASALAGASAADLRLSAIDGFMDDPQASLYEEPNR